ncbi:nuclear transport factor 2 family protein [Halopseudomonas xiamenensis]|uniref:nuclear transport factor 2 family protein n=1 Tax=Halopseudomonas xiamenensis TaxID=157792 RepID=UPI001624FDB9|nr:nuclear transport factor 2 family protein [Halopseudomonas xiamenensis]
MKIRLPLEDRIALQDLMTEYCYAVDKLTDLPELLDLFTDDALLDFSDIGLAAMPGKERFRQFYENVFANMTHHTHYISNFRVAAYEGDTAAMTAYVEGLGRSRDGNSVQVHVRYRMDCVKVAGEWKISAYYILEGMPMPESLTEIHQDH